MKSRLRVVILGNESWLVPASHDERRYAVFNVGDGRKQDRKYFTELKNLMIDQGGNSYLLQKLLAFDLNTVDVGRAPDTEGLRDQKLRSLSTIQQWWHDSLEQGYIEGVGFNDENGEWQMVIDKTQFVNTFLTFAKNRTGRAWFPTDFDLMNSFKELVPQIRVEEKSKNSRMLNIILPSLADCRNSWDKYIGFKTEWRE